MIAMVEQMEDIARTFAGNENPGDVHLVVTLKREPWF